MRARPREINIFNMSLLDILCGALGAFCFMMLVALPYYVVGKVDRAASQKRTEELLKEAEQLRERMSDPAQAEELRKLIEELEAQIKQLQGQLNQLSYENDQLKDENARLTTDNQNLRQQVAQLQQEKAQLVADKAQLQDANDQLTQENADLNQQLATKKPFAVMATTTGTQAVDLYLERTRYVILGNKFESFDPNLPGHFSPIPHDVVAWSLENGVSFWVNANSKPGDGYRIYVKFLKVYQDIPSGDTTVRVNFFGAIEDKNTHADIAINHARPWTLVGIVNIGDDGKLSFKEATPAERDEDWRRKMKTDPPSAPTPAKRATPSPSPSGGSTPAASATPNAQEPDERVREYLRRRGVVLPSPSASGAAPSATATTTPLSPEEMERIRKVSEEQRRRIEEMRRQRQASPVPTP